MASSIPPYLVAAGGAEEDLKRIEPNDESINEDKTA